MNTQAKKNSSRARGKSRGRNKSGQFRSRSRNTTAAKKNPAAVARRASTAAAQNPRRKGRGRGRSRSRNGGTYSGRLRNPFTLGGLGDVAKELAYAGGGAFGVSTASQLLPIPVTSPIGILIVQGIIAWIIGWLGGKLLGKKNEALIRTGGFAYAAGNFVTNQFPNLQARILSFSPIKAARGVLAPAGAAQAAAGGADLTDKIMTPEELSDISLAHPYLADISTVQQGQFAY